jgi:hypothetical protein
VTEPDEVEHPARIDAADVDAVGVPGDEVTDVLTSCGGNTLLSVLERRHSIVHV